MPSKPTQRKYSEQDALNDSYDEDFKVIAFELLGYDATNNVLRRVQVDSQGRLLTVSAGSATTGESRYLEDGSQFRYLEDDSTVRLEEG